MTDFLSRQQVQEKLSSLDKLTPALLNEYGLSTEFFAKFDGLANDISNDVGPNDFEWANGELDAILRKHGVDPDAHVEPLKT